MAANVVDWSSINLWCCNQFFSPSEISKHTKKVHCEEVNDLVKIDINLKDTERINSSEINNKIESNETFPCDMSPKSFKRSDISNTLKDTEKMNSGDIQREINKPIIETNKTAKYPCDLCPQIFKRGTSLERHRKILHEGIRKTLHLSNFNNNLKETEKIKSDNIHREINNQNLGKTAKTF